MLSSRFPSGTMSQVSLIYFSLASWLVLNRIEQPTLHSSRYASEISITSTLIYFFSPLQRRASLVVPSFVPLVRDDGVNRRPTAHLVMVNDCDCSTSTAID